MIGIGQLPIAPQPLGARGRTHPYTRRRHRAARSSRAPRVAAGNNADMIFDQPPAELPVATLRPQETGARLLLDVRGWLASKWRWLRPRSIPVAVAFVGMLAVLTSASYLRELATQPPEQLPSQVLATWRADGPIAKLRVETVAPSAGTHAEAAAPRPLGCRMRLDRAVAAPVPAVTPAAR